MKILFILAEAPYKSKKACYALCIFSRYRRKIGLALESGFFIGQTPLGSLTCQQHTAKLKLIRAHADTDRKQSRSSQPLRHWLQSAWHQINATTRIDRCKHYERVSAMNYC